MLAVLDDYVENSSYKGKNSVLERLRSVLNQNIKNANNNLEALLKKIGIDFDANKKSLSAVFNKLVGPNFESLLYSKLDKLFNYGGYLKAMLTKFDPNNAEDYGAAWNSAIVTPLEGNFISGKSVGILEKIKRFPFLSAKNLLGITARGVFAGIATDLYFKAVYNSAEWVFDKLGLYDAEWYINTIDSITPFLFNDLSQNKLDNVIKITHLISKGFRDGGGEVLPFEDIGTLFGDEDYKDMDYEKTVRIFGEIYKLITNLPLPQGAINDEASLSQFLDTAEIHKLFFFKEGRKLIPTESSEFLVTYAKGQNNLGIATRYALKHKMDFILVDKDIYTQERLKDEYQELIIFDPSNQETYYGMTNEYLHYSAEMLGKENIFTDEEYTVIYKDLASGKNNIRIGKRDIPVVSAIVGVVGGIISWIASAIAGIGKREAKRVIFGTNDADSQESLQGGNLSGDYIFGGGGEDILDGKEGDDYLEGGKDFDTYIIQGKDTVLDVDGQGRLIFDNEKGESPTLFSNSTDNAFASDGLWFSVNKKGDADNKFVARQDNDDLIITQSGSGHKATIKNYFKQVGKVEGHPLGIELKQSDVDKTSPGAPKIFDFSAFKEQEHTYGFKSSDNVEIRGTVLRDSIDAGPLKADKDTGFALVARTGAGNDLVFGSFERDWIHGGDDADILNGSRFILPDNDRRSDDDKKEDRDEIIGGGGGDFINGMAGDDVLYADKQESHLEKGNVVITEQGDWGARRRRKRSAFRQRQSGFPARRRRQRHGHRRCRQRYYSRRRCDARRCANEAEVSSVAFRCCREIHAFLRSRRGNHHHAGDTLGAGQKLSCAGSHF
nr:hypothetical protein [uncultured Cardiobacterium sp.]